LKLIKKLQLKRSYKNFTYQNKKTKINLDFGFFYVLKKFYFPRGITINPKNFSENFSAALSASNLVL